MGIREFFIQILLNIAVLMFTVILLILSIPVLMVYGCFNLIGCIAELISKIAKSYWDWIMNKYKDLIDAMKD